jgi:predicted RNase H-like nuclease (RuvC/YqgF family)
LVDKNKMKEKEEVIYSPLKSKEIDFTTSQTCFVQVRLLDGSKIKVEFQTTDKLSKICDYVLNIAEKEEMEDLETYKKGILLSTIKKFTLEEVNNMTIEEAKISNGNVFVTKSPEDGYSKVIKVEYK